MTHDGIKYGYSQPAYWPEAQVTDEIKNIPKNGAEDFYIEVIVPYGRRLEQRRLNQIIPGLEGYHVVVLFTADDKTECPESHNQKVRETAAAVHNYKDKENNLKFLGAAVSVEMCYHSYQNPRNRQLSREVILSFHKK